MHGIPEQTRPKTSQRPKTRSKQKSKAAKNVSERPIRPRVVSHSSSEQVARRQTRSARLEVRITPADKELFAQAAEERGMNPTELALYLIRRVSRQVRERARILKYSKRDQEALIASLMEPGKPNTRLRQANKRYESLFLNE